MEDVKKNPENKKRNLIKEIIIDVLIVVLITATLSFFIKPTIVKGISMMPTLQDGNYLVTSAQSYRFGKPDRGDVVIFPHTEGSDTKLYIKRVIAIPGDHIEVHGSVVKINGKVIKENYINEPDFQGEVDMKIPKGEIFVMGDNRNNSYDSRAFGTVKIKQVEGVVFVRLYPFDKIDIF